MTYVLAFALWVFVSAAVGPFIGSMIRFGTGE